jgi:DNA-binding GntR family transcriptional regulator
MEEKSARNSIENTIYDKIKQAIVSKMLLPGTKLIEQTLSEKFNVSRTPVRNAFKRLEHEGYITIVPNKGACIIQPTKEEILEAFKIRTELELLSIKFALNMVEHHDIHSLNQLIQEETSALTNNNVLRYLELNKEFHLFLAKKSKNKFLIEFLDQVLEQINVYLILYDTYYNVNIENIKGIEEHKHIISLIESKNTQELSHYLKLHIDNSLEELKIDQIVVKSLDMIF